MTLYTFIPFVIACLAGTFLGVAMFNRYGWVGAIGGAIIGFFGVISVCAGAWLLRRRMKTPADKK